MSLYSGIKFTAAELAAEAALNASEAAKKSKTAADTALTPSAPSSSSSPAEINKPAVPAKASAEWSASLKFAPRLNKPKPTTTARPPTTSYSAEPTVAVGIVKPSEAPSKTKEDEIVLGVDGKPLAKAPAMTLAAAGQKEWSAREKEGWGAKRDRGAADARKKKKKKKRRQIMPTFDPDEQYDPNRPNDLGEYQQYRKQLKEDRRAKLAEEKRRKAAGEGSDDGSSYYTDSEEEVAPRRDAPKLFAPPKMYSPPPGSRLQAPPIREARPSAAVSTGDDAYARRLALSQAATGNDAYARRAALASAANGDNAYARRAALVQASAAPPPPLATTPPPPPPPPTSAPPAPPPISGLPTPPAPPSFAPPAFQTSSSLTPAQPSFVPPPAHLMAQAPPSFSPPPAHLVAAAPSGPPAVSGIPGFGNYGHAAPLPAQIPTPPIATPSASGASQDDFTKMLEERRKAAEAIAAKFKSLPGAPPPPMSEVQGATFAEKMLNRYGHKEGQGLGARGDGILHALTTEHVAPPPKDPSQPLSKRQLAKQKAAAANAKTRKWVQHSTTRGKIVNANEEAGEKERDASRVVCLIGLVGNEEEVDEGLADEIGEECSRIGVVERVLLHMVEPPPPEPSECLRVFVVFSGLAGAWRATKELDGRFFGGRKIRAVYFDETKFNAGDRDGPVE